MAWAVCLMVGLVAVVAWALILFVSTPVLVTLAMLPLIALFHPLYSPVEMLYLILEGGYRSAIGKMAFLNIFSLPSISPLSLLSLPLLFLTSLGKHSFQQVCWGQSSCNSWDSLGTRLHSPIGCPCSTERPYNRER